MLRRELLLVSLVMDFVAKIFDEKSDDWFRNEFNVNLRRRTVSWRDNAEACTIRRELQDDVQATRDGARVDPPPILSPLILDLFELSLKSWRFKKFEYHQSNLAPALSVFCHDGRRRSDSPGPSTHQTEEET